MGLESVPVIETADCRAASRSLEEAVVEDGVSSSNSGEPSILASNYYMYFLFLLQKKPISN